MNEETISSLGEAEVIKLFASAGPKSSDTAAVVVPNGDDAAVIRTPPGQLSVLTTDALVEEIHFSLKHGPPENIGRKLFAVNLSDVAAMGAAPKYALLSIALASDTPIRVVNAIVQGIDTMAHQYDVRIIGGNLSSSPGPMMLSMTLWGEVESNHVLRREGAERGDAIFVTGYLGRARAGLSLVTDESAKRLINGSYKDRLIQSFLDPIPRVAAGQALARSGVVRSMSDISDGFGRDLRNLLAPEGRGAQVQYENLPISPEVVCFCKDRSLDAELFAMQGGEDYELLFTARADDESKVIEVCSAAQTPVARVGYVLDESLFDGVNKDGERQVLPGGFEHF